MNKNNTTRESDDYDSSVVIENIIRELDNGVSFSTLQQTYEDHPEALKTVRFFYDETNRIKQSAVPDPETVAHLLHKMGRVKPQWLRSATGLVVHGYDYVFNMMKNILKIGLPVLALALIIIGVKLHQRGVQNAESPLQREERLLTEEQQGVTPPVATGNIDDIISSFDQEEKEVQNTAQSEDSANTINDRDTINNYGNTYNENQF